MEPIEEQTNKPLINVWYVTGATSGIGEAMVKKILKDENNRVVGTSRDAKKFESLEFFNNPNFLGLGVDLPNEESVKESVRKTVEKFGTITHCVNAAGYGIVSCIEEISDKEQRDMFDCIYYGPLNVVRSILPIMRSNKFGYIFNVASTAGFRGFSMFGAYAAPKFALVGMTEALASEVKPFGINVAAVILGYFKTGFQTGMSNDFGYAKNQLVDVYDTKNKWINFVTPLFQNRIPGDPNKFADLIVDHYSKQSSLPYNLFIGPEDTFSSSLIKIRQLEDQINSQKELNSKVLIEQI